MSLPGVQAPHILVADFGKPTVTYRVAAARTRSHDELISICYRIFNRRRSTWHAHFHFDPPTTTSEMLRCTGRAAECEWDDGRYFGEEIFDSKILTLYVHFEKVNLDEKIEEAKRKLGYGKRVDADEEEMKRLRALGDDKADEGDWWAAMGWWKQAAVVEKKMIREGKGGEAEREAGVCGEDMDEAIVEKRKSLPDNVKNEIADIFRAQLATFAANDQSGVASVFNTNERLISTKNLRRKKRRLEYESQVEASQPAPTIDHSSLPWPIYFPFEIPEEEPEEVMTIDAYSGSKLYCQDLIVGRALPSFCLKPNIRPLVRAILVASNVDKTATRVYAFIPSIYTEKVERTGECQIPLSEVEYFPKFTGEHKSERSTRIKRAIMEMEATRANEVVEQDSSPMEIGSPSTIGPPVLAAPTAPAASSWTTIDTYSGSNYLKWDIIIGVAKPEVCGNPSVRPLVRAALTEQERIHSYMPARHGVDRNRTNGELMVRLSNVDILPQFDAPTELKMREHIRDALITKHEVRLGGERHSGEHTSLRRILNG